MTSFRPAAPTDLQAMLRLEQSANPHPWTSRQLEEELAGAPRSAAWVVTEGDELRAHLVTWVVLDEWHILQVATDPAHRRRGYARNLLRHGAAQAAQRGCTTALLEVRAANTGARALYASLGFAEVGRRAAYYRPDGDDAVLMSAPVSSVAAAALAGTGPGA